MDVNFQPENHTDTWTCPTFACGFWAKNEEDLENHMINVHGKVVVAESCGYVTGNDEDFNKVHESLVPQDPALICSVCVSNKACGYVALNIEDLDKHMMIVHGECRITDSSPLESSVGERRQLQKKTLSPGYWKHARREENKENIEDLLPPKEPEQVKPKVKSRIGSTSLPTAEARKRKSTPILQEMPCPYKDTLGCTYIGTRKNHFESHIKTHLPEDEKKNLQCDRCERKFADKSNLARHKRQIHDKLLIWRCDKCNPPFASSIKRDLMRHYGTRAHKSMEQRERLTSTLNALTSRPRYVMAGNILAEVVSPTINTYEVHTPQQDCTSMANQEYAMQFSDFTKGHYNLANEPLELVAMPLLVQHAVAPCFQTQPQQVIQDNEIMQHNVQVHHALSTMPADVATLLSNQPGIEVQEIISSSSHPTQSSEQLVHSLPMMPKNQVQQLNFPMAELIPTGQIEVMPGNAPIKALEDSVGSSVESPEYAQLIQDIIQMPLEQDDNVISPRARRASSELVEDAIHSCLTAEEVGCTERDNVVLYPNQMACEFTPVTSEFLLDELPVANLPLNHFEAFPVEGSRNADQNITFPNQIQMATEVSRNMDNLSQQSESTTAQASIFLPMGKSHNHVEEDSCEVERSGKEESSLGEMQPFDSEDKNTTGNKVRSCDQCGSTFYKEEDLKRHMITEDALQGLLTHNMEALADTALDTREIANKTRELLYTRGISQKIFAKHVLGASQSLVCSMLNQLPRKPWEKLNKRQRHNYRMMHAWCHDEDAIKLLKSLMPTKKSSQPLQSRNLGRNLFACVSAKKSNAEAVMPLANREEKLGDLSGCPTVAEIVAVPKTGQTAAPEKEEVPTMVQDISSSSDGLVMEQHEISRKESEDNKLSQYSSEDFGNVEGSPGAYDFKIGLVMGAVKEDWRTS